MRLPKLSTHFFVVVGLLLVASISVSGYASLKPLLDAHGSPQIGPNGKVIMTLDQAAMWRVDWFAYSAMILAIIAFIWLVLRLIWLLILRFRRNPRSAHRT